jgi:hypothetical protein
LEWFETLISLCCHKRRSVTDVEDCFLFRNGEQTPRYEYVRNGRCTWMAVEVLESGTDDQRRHLLENYGHDDNSK